MFLISVFFLFTIVSNVVHLPIVNGNGTPLWSMSLQLSLFLLNLCAHTIQRPTKKGEYRLLPCNHGHDDGTTRDRWEGDRTWSAGVHFVFGHSTILPQLSTLCSPPPPHCTTFFLWESYENWLIRYRASGLTDFCNGCEYTNGWHSGESWTARNDNTIAHSFAQSVSAQLVTATTHTCTDKILGNEDPRLFLFCPRSYRPD